MLRPLMCKLESVGADSVCLSDIKVSVYFLHVILHFGTHFAIRNRHTFKHIFLYKMQIWPAVERFEVFYVCRYPCTHKQTYF